MFARVPLNQLNTVPEKPAAYPEFSMFGELPAWGMYIRHAMGVEVSNLKLSCIKKDYRTAIVLHDVARSQFTSISVKEPDHKKPFYQYNSTGIIVK